jgi:hypothetical protein
MPQVQLIARHTITPERENEVFTLLSEFIDAARAEPGNLGASTPTAKSVTGGAPSTARPLTTSGCCTARSCPFWTAALSRNSTCQSNHRPPPGLAERADLGGNRPFCLVGKAPFKELAGPVMAPGCRGPRFGNRASRRPGDPGACGRLRGPSHGTSAEDLFTEAVQSPGGSHAQCEPGRGRPGQEPGDALR